MLTDALDSHSQATSTGLTPGTSEMDIDSTQTLATGTSSPSTATLSDDVVTEAAEKQAINDASEGAEATGMEAEEEEVDIKDDVNLV